MVELFLKYGVDANAKDSEEECLLSYATSPRMFELLVRYGADPKARDGFGNTLLAFNPTLPLADLILEAGVGIDDANNHQETPLMFAALEHNRDLVEFLVDHGANIEARDEDGRSVLWYVEDRDILVFLLERGADPNAVDNDGATPLMSCETGLVEVLVEHGANIEARDNEGCTALIRAAHSDKILALLEHGARVDVRDNVGRPALMCCLANMIFLHEEESAMGRSLEALLETGVQPDSTNADGQTLLMILVEERQPALAGMLLDRGADPLLQDNNGESAFSMACKLQDKDMLRTMVTHSPAITAAMLDELAATGQFHNSTLKKLRKLVAGRG